jgi:HD-like signal output (HDOD) protein/CheY-like chemotaxis protein
MKNLILFVGEEQALWDEFKAQCADPNAGWTAAFSRTGAEAVAMLDGARFGAVVADSNLPDRSGVDLLDEIMARQPQALRIVLSDIADTQNTVNCIGKGHRHLLKPCDASTLLNALAQAVTLEGWLPSEAVQGLIAQMRRVPSPPTIYFQVVEELQSADASVEKLGELIAQDPAIAAKVLQLANSAVFGLQLQVIQPAEAVAYIGLETTRALVLLAHTFSQLEQLDLAAFSIESLWHHSVSAGQIARQIAELEQSGVEVAEQAFAAGLLHDIGKLLFAANLPELFGQALTLAREQQCALWEAEGQIPGVCHAELGACLLGIWGLPTPIVEAVALHHYPGRLATRTFGPLAAVHVANTLEHELRPEPAIMAPSQIDLAYLGDLGLADRLDEWRRNCLTPAENAAQGM